MAKTVNPVTPLYTSAAITKTTATAETVTIAATTAQSALDFSKLVVTFEATLTTETVITLGVGTQYSEIGQGTVTFTVGTVASATGFVIVGGASFESARFQNSSGNAVFTIATTGATVLVSATMCP